MSPAPRLERWIVTLALVSALAGFAAGRLSARLSAEPLPSAGAFGEFRRAFEAEFQLSPDRRRALASVLDAYQGHLETLQARGLAALGPELARLNQSLTEILRNRVLPESERERFDQLCRVRSPAWPAG